MCRLFCEVRDELEILLVELGQLDPVEVVCAPAPEEVEQHGAEVLRALLGLGDLPVYDFFGGHLDAERALLADGLQQVEDDLGEDAGGHGLVAEAEAAGDHQRDDRGRGCFEGDQKGAELGDDAVLFDSHLAVEEGADAGEGGFDGVEVGVFGDEVALGVGVALEELLPELVGEVGEEPGEVGRGQVQDDLLEVVLQQRADGLQDHLFAGGVAVLHLLEAEAELEARVQELQVVRVVEEDADREVHRQAVVFADRTKNLDDLGEHPDVLAGDREQFRARGRQRLERRVGPASW